MRYVRDILEEKKSEELVWIGPLESVFDALKLMNEKDVGAVLVQIDDYLVGILSERDYMRKVILDIHAAKQTKVSEIMTNDVITVTSDDTVVLLKLDSDGTLASSFGDSGIVELDIEPGVEKDDGNDGNSTQSVYFGSVPDDEFIRWFGFSGFY